MVGLVWHPYSMTNWHSRHSPFSGKSYIFQRKLEESAKIFFEGVSFVTLVFQTSRVGNLYRFWWGFKIIYHRTRANAKKPRSGLGTSVKESAATQIVVLVVRRIIHHDRLIWVRPFHLAIAFWVIRSSPGFVAPISLLNNFKSLKLSKVMPWNECADFCTPFWYFQRSKEKSAMITASYELMDSASAALIKYSTIATIYRSSFWEVDSSLIISMRTLFPDTEMNINSAWILKIVANRTRIT